MAILAYRSVCDIIKRRLSSCTRQNEIFSVWLQLPANDTAIVSVVIKGNTEAATKDQIKYARLFRDKSEIKVRVYSEGNCFLKPDTFKIFEDGKWCD